MPFNSSKLTVVLESGLAGLPLAWTEVAHLLEPEFHVVLHRRAAKGGSLVQLAVQLHDALSRSAQPSPYLIAAHSFGALVARQFAILYRSSTAGLVYVDGLPPTFQIVPLRLQRAILGVRFAQLIATLGLTNALLPFASRHSQAVEWALLELRKLPFKLRHEILREWQQPGFYGSLARSLGSLPGNLSLARSLVIPSAVPTFSLYSDYPDPEGERIEHAGHWIHVDQPQAVAASIRKVAQAACHNRNKGV